MNRTAAQAAVAKAKTAVATAAAAYDAAEATRVACFAALRAAFVAEDAHRSDPSIAAALFTAQAAWIDARGVVDDAQAAYDVARTTYRSTAAAASAVTG